MSRVVETRVSTTRRTVCPYIAYTVVKRYGSTGRVSQQNRPSGESQGLPGQYAVGHLAQFDYNGNESVVHSAADVLQPFNMVQCLLIIHYVHTYI